MRRAEVAKRRKRQSWDWEFRDVTDAHRREFPAVASVADVHVNDHYIVQRYEVESAWGLVDHLIIRRVDSQAVHSWGDLQRIKDELTHPERTAVEIYPPASELVDQAHCYHLFVLPLGAKMPFGLKGVNGLGRPALQGCSP